MDSRRSPGTAALAALVILVALAHPAGAGAHRTEWTDETGLQDVDVEFLPLVGIPVPEVDIVRAWLDQTQSSTRLSIQVVDLAARTTPDESLHYGMSFRGNGCSVGHIDAIYIQPFDQWIAAYSCYDGTTTAGIRANVTLDTATNVLRIDVPAKVFDAPAQGRISTIVCTWLPTGCGTLLPITFRDSTAWAAIAPL